METYDPLVPPNKGDWLALPEHHRIERVRDFHENSVHHLDVEALTIHSLLHVIVENQIALGGELLPETIAKLIRQGLDRHEAIHAIGTIVSEDVFKIIRGEVNEFSPKQYRRKLEKITAKHWRKGQY